MSDDRTGVTVRLNATQHELLRRRALSDGVSLQQVLAAGVNAYVLGDLRVLPNGRYHVVGPTAPPVRDDEVVLRAPTTDQPERTVTLRQPPANGGRVMGTRWLTEYAYVRSGKKISTRMVRRVLAHMEEHGMIDERPGRYWRFDGPEDPNVVKFIMALDDGTYDEVARLSIQSLEEREGSPERSGG